MRFKTLLLSIIALLCVSLPAWAETLSCIEATTDIDLDSNATAQLSKNSRGVLCGYFFYNAAASARYLRFYDKATAATVGTDTPKLVLELPAGGAGHIPFPGGILFGSGISFATTTGRANNDASAPTANDVLVDVIYK